MTERKEYLTVRLDDDLADRLAELAAKEDRSKSGEARVAIRNHLDTHLPPRTEVQAGGDHGGRP